jgi:putative lipoic acid-binding regulatory protein
MFLFGDASVNEKNGDQKVNIDYPCRWFYTVIGSDEAKMRTAIADVIAGAWEITASRSSATGKYISLNIAVQVENEQRRIAIYEALRKEPSLKMVL